VEVIPTFITWTKGKGSACASDLGMPRGTWPSKLVVESTRTGVKKTFFVRSVHRDRDRDVTHVNYRAQGMPGVELTVFND
jgi:hypothetical protein